MSEKGKCIKCGRLDVVIVRTNGTTKICQVCCDRLKIAYRHPLTGKLVNHDQGLAIMGPAEKMTRGKAERVKEYF